MFQVFFFYQNYLCFYEFFICNSICLESKKIDKPILSGQQKINTIVTIDSFIDNEKLCLRTHLQKVCFKGILPIINNQ